MGQQEKLNAVTVGKSSMVHAQRPTDDKTVCGRSGGVVQTVDAVFGCKSCIKITGQQTSNNNNPGDQSPLSMLAEQAWRAQMAETSPADRVTALNPSPYADHRGHRKNLSGTHRGNRYCLECKVPVGIPTEDTRTIEPTPDVPPVIEGYTWTRSIGENRSSAVATDAYCLYADGPGVRLAAYIEHAGGFRWVATGHADDTAVLLSPADGVSLQGAFGLVVGHMRPYAVGDVTHAISVRRNGREIIIDEGYRVMRDRDGAQGVVTSINGAGTINVEFVDGSAWMVNPVTLLDAGFCVISTQDYADSIREAELWAGTGTLIERKRVAVKSGGHVASKPVRTNLNRRKRKATRKSRARSGGKA